MNEHHLINKHQHGFLKKHSTVTNLLESVNDWTLSLSRHNSVVIAYIDFQRAFDSVPHPKLLHKLVGYGIGGNLLFWLSSFLTGRQQCVRVGSSLSQSCVVTSGVPQGSVVGPLLFNLYINDITDNLDFNNSSTKIFADDVKIYTEITNKYSSTDLQKNLDLIYQWSTKWQLTISHSKCNILHLGNSEPILNFFISGIPILKASHTTDLGVLFDPDLKFKTHITDIVKRAKQRASLIHRCFISRDIKNLIRSFKTYVRPLVEYAPQIWSPHLTFLIDLIEGVQRAFTKRLPGFANKTYAERLQLLQIQSLEHRRLLYDLTLCFNIVHGFTALSFEDFFSLSNNTSTRGHSLKLVVPIAKTNMQKFFFSSRIIPIWNSLPQKIVSASSTAQFKSLISKHDLTFFLSHPTFNHITHPH